MKDAKRLSQKMKDTWEEEFVSNVRRNPMLKDPAYIEWLAAFSFTVVKEGVNVAKLSERLGLSRTYVYPVLKGRHAARQDVMEKAATALMGLPMDAFREYGRTLLGGPEKVMDVLKMIVVDRFIVGHGAEGAKIEERKDACFMLPRAKYSREWGPLTELAVFEGKNNWAVVDLDPEKTKAANNALVVEDGKLEVREATKAEPWAQKVGAVVYWVAK